MIWRPRLHGLVPWPVRLMSRKSVIRYSYQGMINLMLLENFGGSDGDSPEAIRKEIDFILCKGGSDFTWKWVFSRQWLIIHVRTNDCRTFFRVIVDNLSNLQFFVFLNPPFNGFCGHFGFEEGNLRDRTSSISGDAYWNRRIWMCFSFGNYDGADWPKSFGHI